MLDISDISIKNKLVLMQVFTSVLVLGICFVAFVITDINGYKERKVDGTISIAQVIGTNSVSSLTFLDNEAAEEILKTVDSDVSNATILDQSGNVFAKYTKPNLPAYKFLPPFRDTAKFENDFLYVYKNIVSDNTTIGTVCLQVELTELRGIKNQKYQLAAILLAVGIALSFFIATLNQRYISTPLLYLVKVMKQIRENSDYSRHVEVQGKDEISTLSLEFNNLMEEVVKSHQKKDEFIGIASHELKTPLTSVKLYLETLVKMPHKGTTQQFILKARDGVNKLQNLILDLLDVSKIQSGQLQLDLKTIEIGSLINECIADCQASTSTHTITNKSKLTDGLVMGDKDRIEQVVNNLLSNAIKYSPQGKIITVTSEKKNSKIKIGITDDGIGIPKSEQKKIFDRFYRAKGSNSVISGFGLGLYICAQIIKRHKGSIWVQSEDKGGSTFYFELPMVD